MARLAKSCGISCSLLPAYLGYKIQTLQIRTGFDSSIRIKTVHPLICNLSISSFNLLLDVFATGGARPHNTVETKFNASAKTIDKLTIKGSDS